MIIKDWLSFSDRSCPPGFADDGLRITTDRFYFNQMADFSTLGQVREEWCFRSILVPIDDVDQAVKELSYYDTEFQPGWRSDDTFFFGDERTVAGVRLYPWIRSWKHPLSDVLVVRLRDDFVDYHCLIGRKDDAYIHPVDEIEAAKVGTERHSFFNPTPVVVVYADYLREYLWARKYGLIISCVADRFANGASENELGVCATADLPIDNCSTVTNVIHLPGSLSAEYFTARASLFTNYVVGPHDKPRPNRTPWYYFGNYESQGSPALF